MTPPLPQLKMTLSNLKPLSESIALPEGYAFGRVQPSEFQALADLLGEAFPEMVWDVERARKDFYVDQTVKEVWGVYDVASETRRLAATASARHMKLEAPGYVHWVGATAADRGKGLGGAVTMQVLIRFREWGLNNAILETDDARIPAIRTYLKLGFLPDYPDESHRERWKVILAQFPDFSVPE